MKKNLLMVGLPIAAGLSLTLASCGNPAAETEEDTLQQPGAVPTQIDDDEEDRNVPGKVTDQDADEDGENEND